MTTGMWIALLGTFLVAVMSPGPDFLVVLRTSLSGGRSVGRMSAAGIAAGTVLWIIATLVGIVAVINSHPVASLIIRLVGTGFLAFYGLRITLSTLRKPTAPDTADTPPTVTSGGWAALRLGFVTTTVGNPKAVVFYTAFFASLVPPEISRKESLLLAVLMVATSYFWFVLVATLASNRAVMRRYQSMQRPIDLILGIVLTILGLTLFPWSGLF